MRPPPPLLGAGADGALPHRVAEGVMTLVTVPAPEYASDMEDCEPLQVLSVTSLVTSEESCWKVGDDTMSDDPEARVTEKLLALTVID